MHSHSKLHIYYFSGILILNLLSGIFTLPVDDEMYYWTWSQHLDWGYFDHPPLIALWVKLSSLFTLPYLNIRALSVFSFVATLLIWKQIIKPKSTFEIHLFYALFLSVLGFQIFGFISTPDTVFLLFGSLYLWILQKTIKETNLNHFIQLAFAMALVMYSKYFGLLLIIFSLLPLLKTWLKLPWFYGSVLLSIVLYLPHLYWQYEHDWVSINYHLSGRQRQTNFEFSKMLNYLLGFLAMGSLVFWTIPYSKLKFKGKWNQSLWFIIIGSFAFFFLVSFFINTQAQWNLLIYMAILPFAFQFLKFKSFKHWRVVFMYALIFIFILVRIMITLDTVPTPMSDLRNFISSTQQLTKDKSPVFERYQQTSAYLFYTRESAYNYRVYNHRESQFDLWKSEEQMQGKDLRFFSLEKIGKDSIIDNYHKWEYSKEEHHFTSFPEVRFKVLEARFNPNSNRFYIKFFYENPYPVLIEGRKMQQLLLIINFDKKGFPLNTNVITEDVRLLPSTSGELEFNTLFYPNSKARFQMIGLKPMGVSVKSQSDAFEITNIPQ